MTGLLFTIEFILQEAILHFLCPLMPDRNPLTSLIITRDLGVHELTNRPRTKRITRADGGTVGTCHDRASLKIPIISCVVSLAPRFGLSNRMGVRDEVFVIKRFVHIPHYQESK
jgi:hypothetical protein